MDIKLRARLSAYSKVDSISSSCDHDNVSKEEIDNLFENMDEPTSVTKTEIDKLFETTDDPGAVTKTEIDSLFEKTDEPTSVSKDQIDDLFVKEEQPIVSVSHTEIDSLFK